MSDSVASVCRCGRMFYIILTLSMMIPNFFQTSAIDDSNNNLIATEWYRGRQQNRSTRPNEDNPDG